MPVVSVVVPYLRAEATIERAVTSVLEQTLADLEVVAVSDGSLDGSTAIVERLARRDPRVRSIAYAANRGPSFARNRGLEGARGKWVAVLDADDAFEPTRLERLVAAAGDGDVIVDNLLAIDPLDAQPLGPVYGSLPATLSPAAIVATEAPASRYNYGYLKPMMRRAFVERYGLQYAEQLRTGEDLLFLVEAAAIGGSVRTVDEPLYRYTLQFSPKSKAMSSASHSRPFDREMADALEALSARCAALRAAPDADAVRRRIADLRRDADVSIFRHLLHRRRAGEATALLLRSAPVRRYLRRLVAKKFLGAVR